MWCYSSPCGTGEVNSVNDCILKKQKTQYKSLTEPELILQISKANPIVTPFPWKVCQAILTTLKHLKTDTTDSPDDVNFLL